MRIENLCFSFGDKVVFRDFSVHSDSPVICLMGPSGCGKTTLLRLIAGLISPEGGTISGFEGPFSVMFQEDRLLPWLNARDNVALVLDDRSSRPDEILRDVGIDPGMDIRKMSGGMKRRVALARALAFPSGTLVLDEPFNGLDAALMKKCAAKIRNDGRRTVVSTHSETEAEELGAEIVKLI